jgi:pyruvate dehydrogenase E1 component alpha subunit
MSDPASYRTKQELEKYRLDDPITRLRAQLTREGRLTNEQFDLLDKRAKETVLAAVKFAEKSPEPSLDRLYDYTYADGAMEPGRLRPEKPAQKRREGAPSPNTD